MNEELAELQPGDRITLEWEVEYSVTIFRGDAVEGALESAVEMIEKMEREGIDAVVVDVAGFNVGSSTQTRRATIEVIAIDQTVFAEAGATQVILAIAAVVATLSAFVFTVQLVRFDVNPREVLDTAKSGARSLAIAAVALALVAFLATRGSKPKLAA